MARTTKVKAPQRRDEVIDVATRVFHEKGYAAASIQDVADALGMLKGSLYYYIESKEDLLFTIIEQVHRDTMERLEHWLTIEADTLVKVRAFLRWQVLTYCRDFRKVGVFLHDFRSLSPERQQVILDERDRYDQIMRELIRQGQAEGSIAADVDPKLTAMAVFGMMNWISTWWHEDGPNTPEEGAQQFCDFALSGLTAPASGSRGDLGRLPDDLEGPEWPS